VIASNWANRRTRVLMVTMRPIPASAGAPDDCVEFIGKIREVEMAVAVYEHLSAMRMLVRRVIGAIGLLDFDGRVGDAKALAQARLDRDHRRMRVLMVA
jgi:S-adenosylmethionine synthetase